MLGHFVMAGVVAFVALACVGLAAGAGFFAWCCCEPPTCNVSVNVKGCGSLSLANATVTISQGGSTIATGSTNSSGNYTVAIASGSYTVAISKSRFNGYSGSLTHSCPTTSTVNVTLTAATGYACCQYCPDPLPTTLYVTDNNGTHSLTYDATYSRWTSAGIVVSTSAMIAVVGGAQDCATSPVTGNITYYWTVLCSSESGVPFRLAIATTTVRICPIYDGFGNIIGYNFYYNDDSQLSSTPYPTVVQATLTVNNVCAVPWSQEWSYSGNFGVFYAGSYHYTLPPLVSGTVVADE